MKHILYAALTTAAVLSSANGASAQTYDNRNWDARAERNWQPDADRNWQYEDGMIWDHSSLRQSQSYGYNRAFERADEAGK
jgi:hypothetical protein